MTTYYQTYLAVAVLAAAAAGMPLILRIPVWTAALLGDLPDRNRPITVKQFSREPRDGYVLERLELDLNGIVPPEERGALSLRLILHGRRVCKARKPQCDVCVLNDICPSAFKV